MSARNIEEEDQDSDYPNWVHDSEDKDDECKKEEVEDKESEDENCSASAWW